MTAGKRILLKDGFVIPVFFLESDTIFAPYPMLAEDRADKHAMVRLVADAVIAHRAETVIYLSESWLSEVKLDALDQVVGYPVNDPNRRELLSVTAISISGEVAGLWCELTRKPCGIEFGELISAKDFTHVRDNLMEPIRKAFVRLKNAKQR